MENNFLEELTGKEKLYMADTEGEIGEVSIPIEYFIESAILDEAIRNLVGKFNKNPYMTPSIIRDAKCLGFKVSTDRDDVASLSVEYIEQCTQREGETDISYQRRYEDYQRKVDKNIIKPYRVTVVNGFSDEKSFKIRVDTLLSEIDRLLDIKFAELSSQINEELRSHKITREEWRSKLEELQASLPASANEYMKKKMQEFVKYYEYITGRVEYKENFVEEMSVDIPVGTIREAEDRGGHARDRVSDILDFDERDAFIKQFSNKRVIQIRNQKTGEVAYTGYIIDVDESVEGIDVKGKMIVIEPLEGDKSTHVTFETDESIEIIDEELRASELEYTEYSPYKNIMRDVLQKTKNEKAKDARIVTKNHGKTWKKNMEYLITGKGKSLDYMKDDRQTMLIME